MNIFERRNSLLGMELDRYMREHPGFSERIPNNAHIVLLLEGDKNFNEWSTNLGNKQAEKNQPIVISRSRNWLLFIHGLRNWRWQPNKHYYL